MFVRKTGLHPKINDGIWVLLLNSKLSHTDIGLDTWLWTKESKEHASVAKNKACRNDCHIVLSKHDKDLLKAFV